MTKEGAPVRKGVLAKDISEAISKAIAAVEGATISDVDRAFKLGVVDIT